MTAASDYSFGVSFSSMTALKKLLGVGIACLCVQFVLAQTFQQECLNAHNYYRRLHRSPDLVLDNSLTKFAQEWANYLANSGKFEHRKNNKYGENLYAVFGSTSVTGDQPVQSWYDEIKDYKYNNPGFSRATGHFTQVVWKNSKRLGCAIAKKGNDAYIVANYDPPGNYRGQFPANVRSRKG